MWSRPFSHREIRHGWRLLWIIASLVWIAVVAYLAASNWPRLSLDLPGRDPAVRAAFDAAVRAHMLWHGFIALAPPLMLWVLARIFSRVKS